MTATEIDMPPAYMGEVVAAQVAADLTVLGDPAALTDGPYDGCDQAVVMWRQDTWCLGYCNDGHWESEGLGVGQSAPAAEVAQLVAAEVRWPRAAVLSWSKDEQPDLERLNEILAARAGVHVRSLDTSNGEHAMVLSRYPLDEEQAREEYRRYLDAIPESKPA